MNAWVDHRLGDWFRGLVYGKSETKRWLGTILMLLAVMLPAMAFATFLWWIGWQQ